MLFLLSLFDNEHWIILRIKLVFFCHFHSSAIAFIFQLNIVSIQTQNLIEILKYGVRLLLIKQ